MYKYLYIPRDSFFHRLDPRTKLFVWLSFLIAEVVLKPQLYILVGMFVVSMILAYITGAIETVRSVRVILIIIAIASIVSWSLIGSGRTRLFGFITWEALGMGISAGLRAISGVVISLVWLATTRNEEIAAGFLKLGLPYRGAFAFSSALRMAPVLINMSLTVIAAQKSRGLNLDTGGLLKKIKRSIPLIVPAFLLTMRSTDSFAMAIESKGFGYKGAKRTNYLQIKFEAADYCWIVLAVLIAAASIYIASNNLFMQFVPMD